MAKTTQCKSSLGYYKWCGDQDRCWLLLRTMNSVTSPMLGTEMRSHMESADSRRQATKSIWSCPFCVIRHRLSRYLAAAAAWNCGDFADRRSPAVVFIARWQISNSWSFDGIAAMSSLIPDRRLLPNPSVASAEKIGWHVIEMRIGQPVLPTTIQPRQNCRQSR